jgi:hypothetical protein
MEAFIKEIKRMSLGMVNYSTYPAPTLGNVKSMPCPIGFLEINGDTSEWH